MFLDQSISTSKEQLIKSCIKQHPDYSTVLSQLKGIWSEGYEGLHPEKQIDDITIGLFSLQNIIQESNADAAFIVGNSGFPIGLLLRAFWNRAKENGIQLQEPVLIPITVYKNIFSPLNVITPDIILPEGLIPNSVLIFDDMKDQGITMRKAERIVRRLLPSAKIGSAVLLEQSIPFWYSQKHLTGPEDLGNYSHRKRNEEEQRLKDEFDLVLIAITRLACDTYQRTQY